MSGLVQIERRKGEGTADDGRRGLTYGTTAHPNNRAPFARAVIAVTSGKGGVGKSTVAVNIAVSLAQRGLAVGVLDADVHGPSVPRLLGVNGERLEWATRADGTDAMVPAQNFGMKIASVALTTPDADTPLAWRSSVAVSALVQLLEDVEWGPLDVLLIDMPPGTGDVQLTMAQELPITAAVVVTTPQTVATDDVRRAIRMLKEIGVPFGGIVENMSSFTAPDTGAVYFPFGKGGGEELAKAYAVPFLGSLPLDGDIRVLSDIGTPPVAMGTPSHKQAFRDVVDALLAQAPLADVRARIERTTHATP